MFSTKMKKKKWKNVVSISLPPSYDVVNSFSLCTWYIFVFVFCYSLEFSEWSIRILLANEFFFFFHLCVWVYLYDKYGISVRKIHTIVLTWQQNHIKNVIRNENCTSIVVLYTQKMEQNKEKNWSDGQKYT